MGKRTVSAVLVAALAAAFMALAAPSASALTSHESCFVNSLNAERSAVGRPKLTVKSDLVANARNHSEDMAADGTIYHNNNLSKQISGNWWALGENVGMGPTCGAIHDAFMASPGHKANILDKDYNQIGVGVVVKDGTIYVTEVFAGRPSSTGGSAPAPAPKPVVKKTTSAAPKPATAPAPAPKPKPKPAPKPAPLTASPRTVDVLVQLAGMDANQVDPATGAAMGV
ncbi:MAG TPA: CAP domain-containing protein [Actinomycetota bacterium]|nr:CAP domain-containing protein [Actinomycetota bacterium]